MLLVGTHYLKIDSKNRFSMPSKFRSYFNDQAFISVGFEGSIEIRNEEDFAIEESRLKGIKKFDKDFRSFKRLFFANTFNISFDSAGRLTIPQALKDQSGLSKEIVIVGVGENLELWDKKGWEKFNKDGIKDLDFISEKIGSKND